MISKTVSKTAEGLKRSIGDVRNKPFTIVYQVLFDIIFIFLYGMLVRPFLAKIVELLGAFIVELPSSRTGMPSLWGIAPGSAAMSYLKDIFWAYAFAGMGFYLLYSLFQGINWKVASGAAGEKMPFYRFMIRFFAVNILWMAAFALLHFLSLYSDISSAVSERVAGHSGISALQFFVAAMWAVLFYFSAVSYSLLRQKPLAAIKKSFSLGAKRMSHLLPAFLAAGAAMIIIDTALRSFRGLALVIAGIVILLPALAWARIYLSGAVRGEVHD